MPLWDSRRFAEHEFPEPPWLVKPIMPLGGMIVLHGEPGVGKTQFMLTLAQAINSGGSYLGRWDCTQGPVVIIQADMTGPIQQLRVRLVVDRMTIDETYWLVEEDGRVPQVDITTMLYQKRKLVREIRELDPVLICWDTLREVHNLPMNDDAAPKAVYGAARELFPKPTHLFAHHDRKRSRNPDADVYEVEEFMGSQQWRGMAETTMQLRPVSTQADPPRVLFHIHKCRTAPPGETGSMVLEMDPRTMLMVPARAL